ncbi:MAG: RMD1 family protein [Chlamydiia bacterium]
MDQRLSERCARRPFRDCLLCEFPGPQNRTFEVCFFAYGVFVAWGLPPEMEEWLLNELKECERQPLNLRAEDEFSFSIGSAAKVSSDEITVPDEDPLSKLALSHGIAQSVKLSVFEVSIQKVIDETRALPEELASRGRIPLSRRQIRQMMGRLFIERCSVNLHTEILDIPEFFWEYSELEPLYRMMSNYLDLFPRVEVLNKRLDIVHELFGILTEELRHQHSTILEWVIILLISVEVILQLLWHGHSLPLLGA